MKKILSVFALIAVAITLIGCSTIEDALSQQGNIFDDKESVIGFSALSTVMTLHNNVDDVTMYQQSRPINLSATTQDDTFSILSEIDELTPYLDLVSTFMSNGSGFDVEVQASEMEGYEHQMVMSTINMEGEVISYTMYYNETFEDFDDEDFDPEAYDSVLEGIMIIEDVTYTLTGEREVDEGEESLELVAKLDDENYVTLNYEIENDEGEHETEFVYEMFVNNQLVKRIEIEFEQDAEETELSIKFIRGTRESEYEFEVEIDGNKRYIEIEYKIVEDGNTIEEGEAEVSIFHNPETGETVVRYEVKTNGETVIIDDDYDTNEDDEEEDEEEDEEDLDNDDEEDEEENNDTV